MQEAGALADIYQFLFGQFAAALRLLHHRSELLDLGLHQACPALHHDYLLPHIILPSRGVVQVDLGILRAFIDHSRNVASGVTFNTTGVCLFALNITILTQI